MGGASAKAGRGSPSAQLRRSQSPKPRLSFKFLDALRSNPKIFPKKAAEARESPHEAPIINQKCIGIGAAVPPPVETASEHSVAAPLSPDIARQPLCKETVSEVNRSSDTPGLARDDERAEDAELEKEDAQIKEVACHSKAEHDKAPARGVLKRANAPRPGSGKPQRQEKKNVAGSGQPTLWIVHSGSDHGDAEVTKKFGLDVLESDTWHNFGIQQYKERQLKKLKHQQPDLLIIWVSPIRREAQPKRSLVHMLDAACALVLEQQKAGRQAVMYGLEMHRELWGSITHRNNGPVDEDHPVHSLLS